MDFPRSRFVRVGLLGLFALCHAAPNALAQQGAGVGASDAGAASEERAVPPANGHAGDELRPPELIAFVDAEYPAEALAGRLEGSVLLRLDLDAEGNVTEAEVMEAAGHGFDEAALIAARRFRFAPARRGDARVASRIHYRYDFRLPPEPETPAPTVPPSPTPQRARPSATPAGAPLEVTVRGASRAQRLRESAQAVKVIETGEARRRTADTGDVLARTEGVAVQRSGGLGSESRISLHGLTDDQIRFFLDGVPLEFAGFGLGVSSVPLNWIERIEVYRGVVPLRLGTDALGGAIELVTDQATLGTTASAAYTAGAFDTHQLALSTRTLHPRSGFFARAAGFYDTSQNDYVVSVRVPDELGRLHPAKVRRFHDGYRAGGGMVEAGFVDRPWARRFLLRVFATSFDKELQHNSNVTVPYGEVTYGQAALGGTLRYEQPRVAGSRIGAGALAGYSRRYLDFRDSSRWVYDWFGNRIFERTAGSGETSAFASDLTQWEDRLYGRVTLTGELARGHVLRWVASPDLTERTGEERLRVNPERIDPLTTRRQIFQLTSGVEYEARDRRDRVENSLFGKYYLYRPSTDQVQTFDNSIRHVEDSLHRVGAGDAFRARIFDGLIGKLSYEYATRLPRPDEVFGDGAIVLPNLELLPETSHNANLGLLVERELGRGELSFEATGFLRRTENMVVRLLAQDRVHAIHQNVFGVRTLGVDGALGWVSAHRWVTLQANATWQDQRNASTDGPFAPFDGQRVPNRPWLFANASAALRIPRLGAPNASLTLSWATRYVHEFLPGWEETTAADDTNRVPSQLTHGASAVYSVSGPWTVDLALDVSNLTDERVFDVLGVQKPGRAAFFKLTVSWSDENPAREGADE